MNPHTRRCAAMLCALLLAGCQSLPPEHVVTVTYRETMQFTTYLQDVQDSNPTGSLGLATYYSISCISNTGRDNGDFTFDISRVHLDIHQNENRAVTSAIASTSPATGWKNDYLSAGSVLVPKGKQLAPAQPFAFVVPIQPFQSGDEGQRHPLRYDADNGQQVIMVPESGLPAPAYKWGADYQDFRRGQRVGTEALPPPRCA